MSFGNEMKDFVAGFKTGSEFVESGRKGRREQQAQDRYDRQLEEMIRHNKEGEAHAAGFTDTDQQRRYKELPTGSEGEPVQLENGDAEAGHVLAKIRQHEAGDNPYNKLVGGQTKDLTNMTVGQVMDFQKTMPKSGHASSALGAYQFINPTLAGIVKETGTSLDAKFTPQLQDQFGYHLLKRRGWEDFKAGKLDQDTFMDNLAHEWAILPLRTGKSVYQGDKAGNKAGLSRDQFASFFQYPKTQTAGTSGSGGTTTQAGGTGGDTLDAEATKGVNPTLLNVANDALKNNPGLFAVNPETAQRRTPEQQAEYKKKGWSQTDNSYHLAGNALDIVPINPETKKPDPNFKAGYGKIAEAMNASAKKLGINNLGWGGKWKTPDMPHWELTGTSRKYTPYTDTAQTQTARPPARPKQEPAPASSAQAPQAQPTSYASVIPDDTGEEAYPAAPQDVAQVEPDEEEEGFSLVPQFAAEGGVIKPPETIPTPVPNPSPNAVVQGPRMQFAAAPAATTATSTWTPRKVGQAPVRTAGNWSTDASQRTPMQQAMDKRKAEKAAAAAKPAAAAVNTGKGKYAWSPEYGEEPTNNFTDAQKELMAQGGQPMQGWNSSKEGLEQQANWQRWKLGEDRFREINTYTPQQFYADQEAWKWGAPTSSRFDARYRAVGSPAQDTGGPGYARGGTVIPEPRYSQGGMVKGYEAGGWVDEEEPAEAPVEDGPVDTGMSFPEITKNAFTNDMPDDWDSPVAARKRLEESQKAYHALPMKVGPKGGKKQLPSAPDAPDQAKQAPDELKAYPDTPPVPEPAQVEGTPSADPSMPKVYPPAQAKEAPRELRPYPDAPPVPPPAQVEGTPSQDPGLPPPTLADTAREAPQELRPYPPAPDVPERARVPGPPRPENPREAAIAGQAILRDRIDRADAVTRASQNQMPREDIPEKPGVIPDEGSPLRPETKPPVDATDIKIGAESLAPPEPLPDELMTPEDLVERNRITPKGTVHGTIEDRLRNGRITPEGSVARQAEDYIRGGPPKERTQAEIDAEKKVDPLANPQTSVIQPEGPPIPKGLIPDGTEPTQVAEPPVVAPPASTKPPTTPEEKKIAEAKKPVAPEGKQTKVSKTDIENAKRAIDAGIKTLTKEYVESKDPVPDPDQKRRQMERFVRNADAPTQAEMEQTFKAVDPEGKLDMEQKMLRAMTIKRDFWLAEGRPDMANMAAANILAYSKKSAQTFGALAMARIAQGDYIGAAQIMTRAYAVIPDGKGLMVAPNVKDPSKPPTGDNLIGFDYQVVDRATGQTIDKGMASKEDMMKMNKALMDGTGWMQQMVDATAGYGKGGKKGESAVEQTAARNREQVAARSGLISALEADKAGSTPETKAAVKAAEDKYRSGMRGGYEANNELESAYTQAGVAVPEWLKTADKEKREPTSVTERQKAADDKYYTDAQTEAENEPDAEKRFEIKSDMADHAYKNIPKGDKSQLTGDDEDRIESALDEAGVKDPKQRRQYGNIMGDLVTTNRISARQAVEAVNGIRQGQFKINNRGAVIIPSMGRELFMSKLMLDTLMPPAARKKAPAPTQQAQPAPAAAG